MVLLTLVYYLLQASIFVSQTSVTFESTKPCSRAAEPPCRGQNKVGSLLASRQSLCTYYVSAFQQISKPGPTLFCPRLISQLKLSQILTKIPTRSTNEGDIEDAEFASTSWTRALGTQPRLGVSLILSRGEPEDKK